MMSKMGARLVTNPLEIGYLCKRKVCIGDDGFGADFYGVQDNKGRLIHLVIIPLQMSKSYAAKKYSIEEFLRDESQV
jgi:hypothetical protein